MSIYSITPADFAYDKRVKDSHRQVMLAFGVHSTRKGWIQLSQAKLAAELEIARETVCRAIKDMVAWGFIEKRTPAQTGKVICFYRIVMTRDEPSEEGEKLSVEGEDDGETSDTKITGTCDVGVTEPVIPSVTEPVMSGSHYIGSNSSTVQRGRARTSDRNARASAAQGSKPPSQVLISESKNPKEFRAWLGWYRHHENRTQVSLMEKHHSAVVPTSMPPRLAADEARKTASRMIGEPVE